MEPTWLTDEDRQIWLDDIGRVAGGRLVGEKDSTIFSTYCNLAGC